MVKPAASKQRKEQLLQKVKASASKAPSGLKKATKTKLREKDAPGALNTISKLADALVQDMGNGTSKAVTGGPKPSRKAGLGVKARARLIAAEAERFSAVLQHAAFQASPFETIENHIANSVSMKAREIPRAPPTAVAPVHRRPAVKSRGRPAAKHAFARAAQQHARR